MVPARLGGEAVEAVSERMAAEHARRAAVPAGGVGLEAEVLGRLRPLAHRGRDDGVGQVVREDVLPARRSGSGRSRRPRRSAGTRGPRGEHGPPAGARAGPALERGEQDAAEDQRQAHQRVGRLLDQQEREADAQAGERPRPERTPTCEAVRIGPPPGTSPSRRRRPCRPRSSACLSPGANLYLRVRSGRPGRRT